VADAWLLQPAIARTVSFTPFLPRREALERLATADGALTLLGPGPGMEMFVGAKLFDALGLDRPVVAMLPPGDARDILAEIDWGIVAEPEPSAVASALDAFLDLGPTDRHADPFARFDRRTLAGRLASVLDEALASSGGAWPR
jgi:hypothetical protein